MFKMKIKKGAGDVSHEETATVAEEGGGLFDALRRIAEGSGRRVGASGARRGSSDSSIRPRSFKGERHISGGGGDKAPPCACDGARRK